MSDSKNLIGSDAGHELLGELEQSEKPHAVLYEALRALDRVETSGWVHRLDVVIPVYRRAVAAAAVVADAASQRDTFTGKPPVIPVDRVGLGLLSEAAGAVGVAIRIVWTLNGFTATNPLPEEQATTLLEAKKTIAMAVADKLKKLSKSEPSSR